MPFCYSSKGGVKMNSDCQIWMIGIYPFKTSNLIVFLRAYAIETYNHIRIVLFLQYANQK